MFPTIMERFRLDGSFGDPLVPPTLLRWDQLCERIFVVVHWSNPTGVLAFYLQCRLQAC